MNRLASPAFSKTLALLFGAACAAALPARADEPPKTTTAPPAVVKPAPTKPASRPHQDPSVPAIKGENNPKNGFLQRHEGFLKDVQAAKAKGDVQLVFLGDSITDGWRNTPKADDPAPRGGKLVWDKNYAAYNPVNLGIGGDQVQHVLWRIENGEIEGLKPKALVLMIGTNNLGGNSNEEIEKGIVTLVQKLRGKLPETKILLLGVFPRAPKPADPARARIKEINSAIAKLDDGKTVKYLDIGDKFLDAEGNLTKEVMPDALHPNSHGYAIWAEAIKPTLDEMLK